LCDFIKIIQKKANQLQDGYSIYIVRIRTLEYKYYYKFNRYIIYKTAMKKTIIPLLTALFAFSVADAATYTITAGASRTFIEGFAAGDDVVLESTATQYSFGGVANPVAMKSLTCDGKVLLVMPGNNSLGTLVDINAASGDVAAVDINDLQLCYTGMTIKNSYANSTATAIVNFDKLQLISGSTNPQSLQNQILTFDNVKAQVNIGVNALIGNENNDGKNTSTIKIANTASVNWNGNATFGKSGSLDVYGTFSMTADTPVFNSGSIATIQDGGTVNLATFTKFANLEQIGTLNQTTADGIGLAGIANFYEGSVSNVKGKLHIYNGAEVSVYQGSTVSLTTHNPALKSNPRIIFEGGKLSLYQNFVTEVTAERTYKVDIGIIGSAESTLVVGADISMGYLNQMQNNTLNIILEDAGILRLDGVTLLSNGIKIFYFDANKVYIGNSVTAEMLSYIKLYGGLTEDTYLGTAGLVDGWLTVVPEPAEWAAIFGALALAFAVYRRRK